MRILFPPQGEELIERGKVKVNGHPAHLGDKVRIHGDIVTVGGKKVVHGQNERVYIMLNKPRGYVTTMNDELSRKCVADLVDDAPSGCFPQVGSIRTARDCSSFQTTVSLSTL